MIDVERIHDSAVVRLSHGKVNALDVELLQELEKVLKAAAANPDVASIVLTGKGRVFSAGVDLRRVLEEGLDYTEQLIGALRATLTALFELPKPAVAAVNGAAVAGGCVLACGCDLRLGSTSTRIGASELAVGVAFPVAAMEILRYSCGDNLERVVLGADLFTASEALGLGILHEVVDHGELLERALQRANELGSIDSDAFGAAKEQMRRPYVERIKNDSPASDPSVVRQWSKASTRARIREQIEGLSVR